MAGVNQWIGVGNLTKDPSITYIESGMAITNFSMACNETWKDKDGNKQEKVEYVNIVAFKRLAEICSEFLSKGQQIFIMGKLQTRSWDDKEGVKRYITEIVASQMQMLGRRDDSPQGKTQEPDSDVGIDKDSDIPF